MKIYIYDIEVFKDFWLVVRKEHGKDKYEVAFNQYELVEQWFTEPDAIYAGFNNKHYDNYIIKAILNYFSPQDIKELNDFIINGNQGFQWDKFSQAKSIWFDSFDIKDDMQIGLSLKAIEAHMGFNIVECDIPFDYEGIPSGKLKDDVIKYCKHDVYMTEIVLDKRKDYLNTKRELGKRAGLSEAQALYSTNAKLTASVLKARKLTGLDDEREYTFPGTTDYEHELMDKAKAFFKRMSDYSIPDDELFKEKLEFTIQNMPTTIAYGGIHGAIKNIDVSSSEHLAIANYDVTSLYPSLMINYNFISRAIPDPKIFEKIYHERVEAKLAGDKVTSNALKLVLNTTYGAMLNKYNNLYDPKQGRAICITGQLLLLKLALMLTKVPSLTLLQINTDGVMFSYNPDDTQQINEIMCEWELSTHLELERDDIQRYIAKDVNNYIMVDTTGKIKKKGGYLVRGISPFGAFNINNNAVVVAMAIEDYLLNNTPVEETIYNNLNDLSLFQIIAKASSKYEYVFQEYTYPTGVYQEEVQRCNRVYASIFTHMSTLYKVKKSDGSIAKIESLPPHVQIYNEGIPDLEEEDLGLDVDYYIEFAKKKINDFLGIENTDRKDNIMPTKKLNLYQKLNKVRLEFINAGVQKSGHNQSQGYYYFELEDIVPVATTLFDKYDLFLEMSIFQDEAFATVIDAETVGQDEGVTQHIFTLYYDRMLPILNKEGKEVTNRLQLTGSTQTYLRRYLYMLVLDLVENDVIDATPPKKSYTQATQSQRNTLKEELTDAEGQADDLQKNALRSACRKLRDLNPDYNDKLKEISKETNKFTDVTKTRCEELIVQVSEWISEVE